MRHSVGKSPGVKSYLKRLVLPPGKVPRVVRGGLLAGLSMEVDFAHQTQLWLGLQERELCSWFRRFSKGIHTAIDVGANEGAYTLYFLAKTSAQRVLAFEPSPENLFHLKGNLELNHLSADHRLEIVPKFVGRSPGNEWIALDVFWQSIISPCLVKVDIDGGEVELLRGAQGLLRMPGVRWIIEVHSRELKEECLEILRAAKYCTVVVPNAWWRYFLPELRPTELNHWVVAMSEGFQENGSDR